jgi:hypothetical protein
MATTTTNFGWDIPQSTDLVKDGATAIAALGQDIDTALVDLKGGTTGQVLAKASGTDLDFSWVAQDDSNAIQNAIVDAKGDLISATAADTPARLAVGTNGQVLTADSTTATGLKWAAAGGGKVKQVVFGETVTAASTASTTYSDTTLTATITPTSASNSIYVFVTHTQCYVPSNKFLNLRLVRGATTLRTYENQLNNGAGTITAGVTFNHKDSPATTSATTYKTQFASTASGGTVEVQVNSNYSAIILVEVEA